jgi:hypothetical protein
VNGVRDVVRLGRLAQNPVHHRRYERATADDRAGTHLVLADLLLRYTQAFMHHSERMTACNTWHSIEQRLCRFDASARNSPDQSRIARTSEKRIAIANCGSSIDQEHSAVPQAQLELMLMACRAVGLDAFARVPPTDYATIMRPMEAGFQAHVEKPVNGEELVFILAKLTGRRSGSPSHAG